MDTPDHFFLATISKFKSQDFAESWNQDVLVVKSLIEDNGDGIEGSGALTPQSSLELQRSCRNSANGVALSLGQQATRNQLQASNYYEQISALGPSPLSGYPLVARYNNAQTSASGISVHPSSDTHSLPMFSQPNSLISNQISRNDQQLQVATSNTVAKQPFPRNFALDSHTQNVANAHRKTSQDFSTKTYAAAEIPTYSPQPGAKRLKPTESLSLSTSMTTTRAAPIDAQTFTDKLVKSEKGLSEQPNLPRSVPHSDEELDSDMEGQQQFTASIRGEQRLNITFEDKGSLGLIPQKFGKANCLIPDGLSGTLQMYEQKWKFEIKHEHQNGNVLIRWTIINMTSHRVTSVLETLQDALNRDGCGRTICNNVLKKAMEERACELEKELKGIEAINPSRADNMRTMIKHLRPKRCTVGLLFFGLLHREIQLLMSKQLLERQLTGKNGLTPCVQ